MQKFTSLIFSFLLLILFITGCSKSTNDNDFGQYNFEFSTLIGVDAELISVSEKYKNVVSVDATIGNYKIDFTEKYFTITNMSDSTKYNFEYIRTQNQGTDPVYEVKCGNSSGMAVRSFTYINKIQAPTLLITIDGYTIEFMDFENFDK